MCGPVCLGLYMHTRTRHTKDSVVETISGGVPRISFMKGYNNNNNNTTNNNNRFTALCPGLPG